MTPVDVAKRGIAESMAAGIFLGEKSNRSIDEWIEHIKTSDLPDDFRMRFIETMMELQHVNLQSLVDHGELDAHGGE